MKSIFPVKKKNNMVLVIIGILLAIVSIGFLVDLILNKRWKRKFTPVDLPGKKPKKAMEKDVIQELEEDKIHDLEDQEEDQKETIKIIGSTQSNKYHQSICRHAQNISKENMIHFTSREDAKSRGYEACGVCHSDKS